MVAGERYTRKESGYALTLETVEIAQAQRSAPAVVCIRHSRLRNLATDLKVSQIVDAPNWGVSAYLSLSVFTQ
jgi:acetamidase/formamidase